MANETANRSNAALILQVFEDEGDPDVDYSPQILGSWGFIESTLVRLTDTPAVGAAVGQYQMQLEQPASGKIDLSEGGFTELDTVVVVQSLALPNFIGCVVFPDVLTQDEAALSALAAMGKPITLPVLVIQVTDTTGGAIDAGGIINVEVRRVPQQV